MPLHAFFTILKYVFYADRCKYFHQKQDTTTLIDTVLLYHVYATTINMLRIYIYIYSFFPPVTISFPRSKPHVTPHLSNSSSVEGWSFTTGVFLMQRMRQANFKVARLCIRRSGRGQTHATMTVRQLPPNESFRRNDGGCIVRVAGCTR